MNIEERIKMVKAMEFIARNVNDEGVFESWLMAGVADGDIEYGDLIGTDESLELEYYCEDENFADTMRMFLKTMHRAYKSGGLYCDKVLSK